MNLKIDTLGKKIGLGYVLMAVVLTMAVMLTILQVSKVNRMSERLMNVRQPSSYADLELLNGINHSIAALRGGLLTKKDTFRSERRQAWKEEIRPSFAKLERLSAEWADAENVQRLALLRPLINQIDEYQQQVEDVSLTDMEEAVALMDEKVMPVNKEIREVLGELVAIHQQRTLEDFDSVSAQITVLSNMEWVLLSLGVSVSFLLAWLITRSITEPVAEAVRVADSIGSGNLDTGVEVRGSVELEMLGAALISMRDSLKDRTAETERYNWLSTGQNKMGEVMQGDKEVEALATDMVTFISEYTGANIGAIYLADGSGTMLNLAGQYAWATDSSVRGHFRKGEGLIGQAASDKKMLKLNDLDEQHIRIRSTVVDAPPKHILVAPFLFEGEALGVIEIGKMASFSIAETEFVQSNLDRVGVAVNSAVARRKIRELLEETQRQSEELQTQQEELQQNNEELEEQTQKLKEQQEELQSVNEELEEQAQIVEQKNSDLETARLDIELKARQLEISSKYKSEFLANMSHELRTPLNSLLILSNDLANNKEKNLSDEQVESAQVIAKSGYDLLNLINEILDLSKIEAGRMDLNIGAIQVNNLAESIGGKFRRLAEEKKLKLRISAVSGTPETIRSDRQRLEQVINNLVSNAIKFTEKGHVHIEFRSEAGGQVAIAVSDTGIGIAADKHQVIFEAFQQAEGGTARRYGGTGLGLSISRELARLLGGRIVLESEPGTGSTFTLLIPGSIGEAGGKTLPAPDREKRPAATHGTAFDGQNSRFVNYPAIEDERDSIASDDQVVLIVDDDLPFAKVLAGQAKAKGFRYLAAATGEDALILARQYVPHAIILDLDLPGMNGNMVLHELKGNPELRHIPVHIISVNERTLDPIRSGAIEYLTKPVTQTQLEDAFSRMEAFVKRKMKNLLVIEDDKALRRAIVKLIGNGDVQCIEAGTAAEALEAIDAHAVDCIVLDIGLPDMNGFELVQAMEKRSGRRLPPVIVYTGRELTREENEELRQYAETIIVKGVKSEERLLDETALFLHRAVKTMPQKKQEMINSLYDKETIFQGRTVLVVDDDMRNVFALSKVLREKGMEILKAENGRAALDRLGGEPGISLVLMDIMMPEMDGYECMRQIRKQKRFADLPVIALTAKAMKEDRQKCIDAGANDYIAKPVDVERLLSMMRIWMKK